MRLITTLICAGVLGLATIPPPPAAAESATGEASLIALFRSICTPDPDPDRGAARALAAGFVPAKKKPNAGGLDDARGFEKTVGDRAFFVIVGRGKGKPRDGMPASSTIACGVGFKGKDEAALAAGRRWVGVPVSRSLIGVGFHGFTLTGGARRALDFDDKPAVKAALLAADMNVLTVSGLGGVSLLMLSRTKAAS